MKKLRLNAEEQRALDDLLEGGFDFFGLISRRETLLTPVKSWSSKETDGTT